MDLATALASRPRPHCGIAGTLLRAPAHPGAAAPLPSPLPAPALTPGQRRVTCPQCQTRFGPALGNRTPRGSVLGFLHLSTTWFQHFGHRSKKQTDFFIAYLPHGSTALRSCTTDSSSRLLQTNVFG